MSAYRNRPLAPSSADVSAASGAWSASAGRGAAAAYAGGAFAGAGEMGARAGGTARQAGMSPARGARPVRKAWVVACACLLAAFTVFVLLDAFVVGRVSQAQQQADLSNIVAASGGGGGDTQASAAAGAGSSSSADADSGGSASEESAASTEGTVVGAYSDDDVSITVRKTRVSDTDVYVADVQVSSAEYLQTALAQGAYGRNLKETTSDMAEEAGAVLAVNGDYYGFRDDGYVVRNGVLYRDTPAEGTDALVVYGDGSMASVSQDDVTAQELVDSGAWQVFSFGPTLVEDGAVVVSDDDEVDQSMSSNPRTAIGMVSPLHYLVVVSDGRTSDNAGLSLAELAQVMADYGATYAYNLDGGGSTTMYFQGEVLNNPTSGNRSGERKVSDIVYFG